MSGWYEWKREEVESSAGVSVDIRPSDNEAPLAIHNNPEAGCGGSVDPRGSPEPKSTTLRSRDPPAGTEIGFRRNCGE